MSESKEVEISDGPRPTGLTVLAVIQFFFCISLLLVMFAPPNPFGVYGVLSPLITSILMAGSAIGYLRQDYNLGFIGGNILGIGSITNILVFNAVQGFENFIIHVPSLVYPVVLLSLLNLRYKDAFRYEAAPGKSITVITCSECSATISADDEICPSCGESLEE